MTCRYGTISFFVIFTLIAECCATSLAELRRRNLPKTNRKIRQIEKYNKLSENNGKWVDLEVFMNLNRTLVKIDGKQIYHNRRNISNGNYNFEYTTGIHFLVLHQTSFRPMTKKLYYTAQPAADRELLRRLANVHDGRIVVIIGYANFTFWLRKEAKTFFYDLGSTLGPKVANGEFWALVFRKGFSRWKDFELDAEYWDENPYKGKDPLVETERLNLERKKKQKKRSARYRYMISVAYEDEEYPSLNANTSSSRPYLPRDSERILAKFEILYEGMSMIKNYILQQATPFQFLLPIKSEQEEKCSWHHNKSLKDLSDFCSLYDGYKPFCRCQDRIPILPKSGGPRHPDYEIIPVAIVTAERLTQVLRQIRKIRKEIGGSEIPIIICVDGFNQEAKHLARLLNVSVTFHDNKFVKGTRERVNEHIGWSLRKSLEMNMDANYTIILEDDLELSPDFVRYFQQIAWLMDIDKTIVIANAYNYNAYPHVSFDPTRLYIVQSYPYYGWMTRRSDALKMLENWSPHNMVNDWDLFLHHYFLNGSYVIIPEVPRTKHIGGGGVHVSGFVQETTYNIRPMNKISEVQLQLQRMLVKAYMLDLMKFLLEATVLKIGDNPCSQPPIPSQKPGGKYVLYLNLTGDADENEAFSTIATCLGYDQDNKMEIMEATFFRKYFYSELLIVACPVSPYCHIDFDSPLIYTPSKSAIEEADRLPFVHVHSENINIQRIPPSSHVEEIIRDNFNERSMHLDD